MSPPFLTKRCAKPPAGRHSGARRIAMAVACAGVVGMIAAAAPAAEPPRAPAGCGVGDGKRSAPASRIPSRSPASWCQREEVLVRPERGGNAGLKDTCRGRRNRQSGTAARKIDGARRQRHDDRRQRAGGGGRRQNASPWSARRRRRVPSPCSPSSPRAISSLRRKCRASGFPRFQTGQQATVRVVGLPDLKGRLRFTAPAIDQTDPARPDSYLAGQQTGAACRGPLPARSSTITERCGVGIPFSAVLYGAGGAIVQVVRDARIETHRVTLGLRSEGTVEAREGSTRVTSWWRGRARFVREGRSGAAGAGRRRRKI